MLEPISKDINLPVLINGKRFTDDRGFLSFANDLDLYNFKRFYIVENHEQNFIRAWHGHLLESKVFFPIQGTFLIAVSKLSDTGEPAEGFYPEKFILSAENPTALKVPAGYTNGTKSLTPNAKLLVLSNKNLEESKNDDYRLPFDFWNIWESDFR